MNNKQAAVMMAIQRGGLIPIDMALEMANQGVFMSDMEDSIDGFSVVDFIEEYDYYDNH